MIEGDTTTIAAKSRFDGDDLRAMFSAATLLLERNVQAINDLNVFPVPDGDTGTNMFLTLRSLVEGKNAQGGASAAAVAADMARDALMGARGNSGVILSQFFKGMAVGLEGKADFGAPELVNAFQEARKHAYRAVGEPVEGTMLTVISSVAEATREALARGGDVQGVCEAACVAARDSVAKTPTLLPVLRDAGVVDAGGQGLSVILEGVRLAVNGEFTEAREIAVPEAIGVQGASGAVSADFLVATDEELYGYCTQLLIEGQGLDTEAVRERMADLARSVVVVGDETMVKVHVHADDPGPVVSLAVSHGTLSQVNIQNMDEQHGEFSSARRREAAALSSEVGVVAIAWGKGLEALFASLGASGIVTGGNTMNPSVQELMEAIERAPSDDVILLPNNRNIVPAAVQAADNSRKTVRVIPTRSIPQGISAILSFNPERDLGSNVRDMEEEASSVLTAEVTEAVRPVTIKGDIEVAVAPGQLIGLLENELVVGGDDLSEVVVSLLRKAEVADGGLVTLYWGDRLTDHEANAVVADVTAAFPGVEVELVEGGQPHYHFIASIE